MQNEKFEKDQQYGQMQIAMRENEDPLNKLLRNANILISNLKRVEYEGMTTLDEAEKPYRDKSVERQREINSEYSKRTESKGAKQVNPNRNHDLQEA